MGAPLLECDNICLVRNGKHILQEVSLQVNEGDFITIIGPNGAGKSMLLKSIIGIEKIDAGQINKKNGLKIGYVPQRIFLDASIPITTFDFLKMVKDSDEASIVNVLDEVNASGLKHKLMHEVSGGEMQRILLARALLHRPDILILDEPAQNLDVAGQLSFYQLLSNLHKQNHAENSAKKMSVLMVSHDLHMVMAATNKVVCLFHHICCSGSPDKITKEPEFIKLFGKDFSDMMAVYNHHHNHSHTHEHDGHDGHHHNHSHH